MPTSPVTKARLGPQLNGGGVPGSIILFQAPITAFLPRKGERPEKTASSARKEAKRSRSRAANEAAKASSVCQSESSASLRVGGGPFAAAGADGVAVAAAVAAGAAAGAVCSA